ncbi:MAG TPA: nuclear transport factor 2 family protein [Mycobacterium sp.]|nr:nuclear transport factor 2 family protein [Mycobacterium sp.]
MTLVRRAGGRALGSLVLAVLAASCASTTGGRPVAEQGPAGSAPAGVPPALTAEPEAPPPPESDEDQIRRTLRAFQDAFNTRNWAAYKELMCPAMRARFNGPVMDLVKKSRDEQGLGQSTVTAVVIDGDTATATLDASSETLGRQTITMPMERGDGWQVCMRR